MKNWFRKNFEENPTSPKKKKEYGIEVPSINSLESLEKLIRLSKQYEIPLAQVNETLGSRLLPRKEIKEMVDLCREEKIGITFSCSMRPEYSYKHSYYRTEWGKEYGRRLNDNSSLYETLKEANDLANIGVRGLIIYDLGVLRVLHKAKIKGYLPDSFCLKASTHCIISNSVTAKIYKENGINDIIPPHDTSLESLKEIRLAIGNTALSVVVDTFLTKGGFIRHNEINDIIDIASPVFIKTGNSVTSDPYSHDSNMEKRVKRIKALTEIIDEKYVLINSASLCCIPKKSKA